MTYADDVAILTRDKRTLEKGQKIQSGTVKPYGQMKIQSHLEKIEFNEVKQHAYMRALSTNEMGAKRKLNGKC